MTDQDRKLTFELTEKQYQALMRLLSATSLPLFSTYDPETLAGLEEALEKQHDAITEPLPFEV